MPVVSALVVGSLFFLSGMTSLVYQNLWIRTLSLGVGSTSASMSIVLSIFFFGLAIGSFISGKIANRIAKPLLFYGLVEGAIGVYSIAVIYALLNFHTFMAMLPLTGSFAWFGTLLKFTLVFLFLILPTVAMGASLPLLIRLFVRKEESLGRYIALLYGVNTLGAVFGAFLTGFFFIPKFGILYSNHGAAVINVLILAVAAWLQRKRPDLWTMRVEQGGNHLGFYDSLRTYFATPFRKTILLTCFATGFTSISAEVVWNKYLGIFFGSNIFGLSLILAIFLTGIALGSIVLSAFIEKIADKKSLFFSLLFIAVLLTAGATYALNFAPIVVNIISYYAGQSVSLLTIKSVVTAVILFLPTSVFGALLPLAIRLLLDSAKEGPEVSGVAYAVNTVGAILGAYFAGIVFIPNIGSAITIKIAILFLVVVGLLLTYFANLTKQRGAVFVALFVLAGVTIVMGKGIEFRNIIRSAYYQYTPENMTLTEALRYFANDENSEEFVRIFEGETAIISLSQDPTEGENYRNSLRLKTNGLNESYYDLNNLDVLPKYEALLGFLPYALSFNPQKAFIVGYGGGFSVNFLTSTDLKEVHVAELERGILQAADFVHNGDNPLLKRKNLRLAVEDARFVMAAKLGGPYDIIISQPSHSWLSGVANLFTKEFFEIVSGNLTDKGIFSQWLNLYNMNTEVLKSILYTFYTVFPHGAVFTDINDEELIMIGSNQPVEFNFAKLAAMAKNKNFQEKLQYVPFRNAYDLVSQMTLSRAQIMQITEGAVLNTDINAHAEVRQSRLFYDPREMRPGEFLNENFAADYDGIIKASVIEKPEFFQGLLASTHEKWNNFYKMHVLFSEYEKRGNGDPEHLYQQGLFAQRMERLATARKAFNAVLEAKPSAEALDGIVQVLVATKDYKKADRLLKSYPRLHTLTTPCFALEIASKIKDFARAKSLVEVVKGKSKEACGYRANLALGIYYYETSQFATALPFLELAYNDLPGNVELVEMMVVSYLVTGNRTQADSFGKYLVDMRQTEADRLLQLAQFYQDHGLNEDAELLTLQANAIAPPAQSADHETEFDASI